MKIGQMIESKFVKKEDLDRPRIATITGISQENVGQDDAPEMKWALNFAEADIKPLILNKINMQLVALACGSEETDDWNGISIILWADPTVSFGGKLVGGVRVRPNTALTQPAPTSAAAQVVPAQSASIIAQQPPKVAVPVNYPPASEAPPMPEDNGAY